MYAIRSYYATYVARGKLAAAGTPPEPEAIADRDLPDDKVAELSAARDTRITSYNVCYTKLLRVPHVESGAEAAEIVRYGRYAPEGDRGLSLCRAHTDFRRVSYNFV